MTKSTAPEIDVIRSAVAYDPDTGIFLWLSRPGISPHLNSRHVGREAGTVHASGYRLIMIERRNYRAHRLVWLLMTGEWPDQDLDHINTLRADNRWINLRLATRADNCHNSGQRKNNSCGFKGVVRCNGRWAAHIHLGAKSTYLGTFDTPEQAHAAYCEAAAPVHGEFFNPGEASVTHAAA